MRSGPAVFKGDLSFYGIDGDVRGEVGHIDTAQCPLYLLTGEYDYSCTPEDTLAVARAVPGAQVTIMKQLGHFPMSENPALFLSYLEPVLADIAARRCFHFIVTPPTPAAPTTPGVPAKAGTHFSAVSEADRWVPASAGTPDLVKASLPGEE